MELIGAAGTLRRRLSLAVGLLVGSVVVGVIGFSILAPESALLDRVYFAVVTLTTVGYGEVIPVQGQPWLELFTMVYMVIGMGLLLFAVSTITASIIELDVGHVLRRRRMDREITALTNHYIVCGSGETGWHIVRELTAIQVPFVVIEQQTGRCPELLAEFPRLLYIEDDATDEDVLERAGIHRATGLCACLPNDKDNLFLTLTARGMNERLRIIARGQGSHIAGKLARAGADRVVSPPAIGGLRMASELTRPHTVSFLDQMLRDTHATHRFGELPLPDGCAWIGKAIRDLPLRSQRVLVVAVRHPSGHFEYIPNADEPLAPDSILVVLAETGTLSQLRAALERGVSPV